MTTCFNSACSVLSLTIQSVHVQPWPALQKIMSDCHLIGKHNALLIGVGADLALVATYINEVSPSNGRAKYTSLIFIMSSLGAFLGIWLGLWLTTPAAPFPQGLPFALATFNPTVSPVFGG